MMKMNKNVYYKHLRRANLRGSMSSCGGVTLRIEETATDTANVTFSICRSDDHYNKKLGRHIVDKRMAKDSHTFYDVDLTEGVEQGIFDALDNTNQAHWLLGYDNHRDDKLNMAILWCGGQRTPKSIAVPATA